MRRPPAPDSGSPAGGDGLAHLRGAARERQPVRGLPRDDRAVPARDPPGEWPGGSIRREEMKSMSACSRLITSAMLVVLVACSAPAAAPTSAPTAAAKPTTAP